MSDAAPTLQDSQGERPFLRLISVGVVATHGTWWGLKMKVSFIGAGMMGQAIARGAAQAAPGRWQFTFFDLSPEAATSAAFATGGIAATTVEDAVKGAEMVVVAVKPQVQAAVLKGLPKLGGATLVSIAAGRTLDQIEGALEEGGQDEVAVARVMPNLNALVGHAASALCANRWATREQLAAVIELFDSVGTTQVIAEGHFGAFTAMAGSSPAWFFQIVDDLARAGVKHGLTKEVAVQAACSSMLGSALMLSQTLQEGGNASDLVDRVCSPGGTTIAGLLAAQERGLGPALVAAVDATIARNLELGG